MCVGRVRLCYCDVVCRFIDDPDLVGLCPYAGPRTLCV